MLCMILLLKSKFVWNKLSLYILHLKKKMDICKLWRTVFIFSSFSQHLFTWNQSFFKMRRHFWENCWPFDLTWSLMYNWYNLLHLLMLSNKIKQFICSNVCKVWIMINLLGPFGIPWQILLFFVNFHWDWRESLTLKWHWFDDRLKLETSTW